MATARTLIARSLRIVGAIAPGETASASEASDALTTMNAMLESWSIDNLMLSARTHEEFTLTAGQQSRTMGPSGQLVTSRPVEIEQALIRTTDSDPTDYPLEIVPLEKWAVISSKQVESSIPRYLLIENTATNLTLYFYPVPAEAYKLATYSWKQLTSIATLDTAVTLAPGGEELLVYELYMRLCPEYGKAVSPDIAALANELKANFKRKNLKPQISVVDDALIGRGGYNIYSGE